MAIVSAEKFVQAARDNGYAVGGFNTNNLEWTQAILRAAEAKKAPVLIQTSMGAAKYMGGYKVCKSLIENTCTTEEQDKFEQSFTTSSRQSKGAGLGLFVVKSLLENEEINYYFERAENHIVFFMKLPQTELESD